MVKMQRTDHTFALTVSPMLMGAPISTHSIQRPAFVPSPSLTAIITSSTDRNISQPTALVGIGKVHGPIASFAEQTRRKTLEKTLALSWCRVTRRALP